VNLYARLPHLKSFVGVNVRNSDVEMVRVLERVSRDVDRLTGGRHFYALTATRYFDGNGWVRLYVGDLIAITTLKADEDGDYAYEDTLVANTDYWLWPDNPLANTPYRAIELNPNSAVLTTWPLGRRRVQVVGSWGFSAEWEATGATVQNDPSLALAATTLTTIANHGIEVGDMLLIETEQVSVTAVVSGNATQLTIARAQNGTTDAAHLKNVSISRRRYPRILEDRVIRLANHLLWNGQQPYMAALEATDSPGVASGAAREAWGLLQDIRRAFADPASLVGV